MLKRRYIIKNKKFKELYKYAKEIHGNVSLINMFCSKYEHFEDFYKIIPIIKHTYKLTDNLYANFINIE